MHRATASKTAGHDKTIARVTSTLILLCYLFSVKFSYASSNLCPFMTILWRGHALSTAVANVLSCEAVAGSAFWAACPPYRAPSNCAQRRRP